MPVVKKETTPTDSSKPAIVQSALKSAGALTVRATKPATPAPGAATPQPGRRLWLWAVGGTLVVGLAGLLYLQPWAASVTEVIVETMAPGPVTRVLAVNGRIASDWSVDVRPQVTGTLAEVMAAEGDVVQSGSALARIDAGAQQAVVRQAMAGLDAAQVVESEAQATHARTKALGSNVARVALENAARAVQSAAQEVARMTALLDQAAIQLQNFTIRAPRSGSIMVLTADPGQIVDPSTVLMTIADLSQLVVETDVDETHATQIKLGQPAALQLSGETGLLAGHVSFVSQKVDEGTGGLAVKLTPDAALVAPIGLTVTANITVEDHPAVITVPRAAIVRDTSGDGVLLLVEGVARRRAVQLIEWPADRLIVTEGLVAGDVVISDATGLADGQAVKVAP